MLKNVVSSVPLEKQLKNNELSTMKRGLRKVMENKYVYRSN